MMRSGLWAGALLPCLAAAALAAPYADYGKPEQCGAYAQAEYDRERWFPGGEAGVMALTDAQSVKGLNALLFEGVITEEGANEPAGRVLATRGPLLGAEGPLAEEVLVIVTPQGIRLLQRCP
ncbi:hypothetical protein [Pseudorhodobacter sp. E13]|uniref:hypothetical protein n=1 Tax=Pseudorhodobacter sp. E13 TaxID=2487931 RepID=UPI000F8D29DD|nr:hypothetical protein [Pseudorhodobacter sp. E13]